MCFVFVPVAPYAGAGIEIYSKSEKTTVSLVAPYAGAGIEICVWEGTEGR